MPCPDCISAPLQTLSLQELQKDFESASPTDTNNNQTTANGASISYITFRPPAHGAGPGQSLGELGSTTTLQGSTFSVLPTADTDPVLTAPPYISFHTIILDMSGVCFVDLMGTKALSKVSSALPTQPGNSWVPSAPSHKGVYVPQLFGFSPSASQIFPFSPSPERRLYA